MMNLEKILHHLLHQGEVTKRERGRGRERHPKKKQNNSDKNKEKKNKEKKKKRHRSETAEEAEETIEKLGGSKEYQQAPKTKYFSVMKMRFSINQFK